MSDGLWAPSTASSTNSPLDGNAVEELMRRSLEDNAYSVQGFWLWQARSIQQRHQREQGRRRPRSEGETLHTVTETDGPRSPAEATAEQHAAEVRAYISALLHATGYPYPVSSYPATGEAEQTEDVALAKTATGDESLEASAPATDAPAAPQIDATPLKTARTEKAATAAPSSASPPKSALAKLVSKAKAQHRDVAEGKPAATVVPTPKNSSFPEDIPGMRLAHGSSSIAQRKRVQFVDAPHDDAASGHLPRREAEHANEEEEDFGVQLPSHVASSSGGAAPHEDGSGGTSTLDATPTEDAMAAKHPSQMTRAEFLSQFKRAPRRGEIGQTAEDIAAAENLGYVMSGSRSVASRMYVDRIQRQLHEHEAAKLQQQFRKVEDERMDDQLVHGLADFIVKKVENLN
ncbi:hypothetical protein ABB37_07578 [Leptomonas pyrrhocoris]|uniref:NF-kappa-B-activating protein C-terminal domain-containing protein n=1 Tax=Leptomonas pyrrhocoris TaxID=157538 RepID=A0A0N0VDW7_LEPPY|nr:hypothetical protein ABB37_07578 [Leptomonas pyrrhocoris]KPA76751.1 hypothetical protein ABB37_07578 [Leptomonas pyrrhocoris]|eukprot:XP_015655190.1 hypothetical protein ABB37_07578 [Leptomonas pyrrhocoris]